MQQYDDGGFVIGGKMGWGAPGVVETYALMKQNKSQLRPTHSAFLCKIGSRYVTPLKSTP